MVKRTQHRRLAMNKSRLDASKPPDATPLHSALGSADGAASALSMSASGAKRARAEEASPADMGVSPLCPIPLDLSSGSEAKRRTYTCRACGQPKKGHVCQVAAPDGNADDASCSEGDSSGAARSSAVPAPLALHPCALADLPLMRDLSTE